MSYRASSEWCRTVETPRHSIEAAAALNRARDEAARAAASAGLVPDARAAAAALLLRCAGKLLDGSTRSYSRRLEGNQQPEKHMKFALALLALILVPVVALAQASLPTELPVDQALAELLKSLGGLQGASALGIALVATQAVMLFFRTPLANFAGKWKLLISAGVAIAVAFLGLLVSGVDWKAAFLHSVTLAAVNTFLHQMVKQITEKPADPA